jgi:hypothetical protein
MASFWYPKQAKKFKFAWQHFGTQSSFESKLILIQQLNEEDWIKLICT